LKDAWATIATEIIIPFVKKMYHSLVPASFVDSLLWLPSKASDLDSINYSEVGPCAYIKCSDIDETDRVFGAVKKQ
jgi:hypothetical protein